MGFVDIGFPCDQFGHQEPGTNAQIEEFCRLNHGVSFPLMAKSDVNGENANEVFKWLYSEKPFVGFGDSEIGKFMDGMLSEANPDYASNPDIKWNFTKFLIDPKGRSVGAWIDIVRIQRAKRLLAETREPVIDIAAAVGIEDQSYFSRLFKKETGLTPSAFRKKMQG